MKARIITALFLLTVFLVPTFAQNFNLDDYQKFLDANKNLDLQGLLSRYPPGLYKEKMRVPQGQINYLDSIKLKFKLTEYEQNLIMRKSFMVSERLRYDDIGSAFEDIWNKDMPVYVSTDAILHTIHSSYDAILKDLEDAYIMPKLDSILSQMKNYISVLDKKYKGNPKMLKSLKDYNVYFTVAQNLLDGTTQTNSFYIANKTFIDSIYNFISLEAPLDVKLFSDTKKTIDFSQFTVRGHYNDPVYPELANYFKSMIWLGRTEFYLIPPKADVNQPTFQDVQRQIIDSYLILEAVNKLNISSMIDDIDILIKSLVGESDNVKLNNLDDLLSELKFAGAADFTDSLRIVRFQDTLATKPYCQQLILSQILFADPLGGTKIQPASSFMLFGQRFIIDSYVFSSLVHDKVPFRMLPNTLDAMFVLGNNAADDLLKDEIDRYNYAPNITALRYLVETFDSTYWQSSLYTLWLNMIRKLNSPDDKKRTEYPAFMQTASWWQKELNTQLASWTELRHDNLLYAKQSYTIGICTCSTPHAFIEPIPEFYKMLVDYVALAKIKYAPIINLTYSDLPHKINNYLENLADISNKLYNISLKISNNTILSDSDLVFLRSVCHIDLVDYGCGYGSIPAGWFPKLYYNECTEYVYPDFLVADVHTSPTDEDGNPVGWVKHVGTGFINMAIIVAYDNRGDPMAFAGPVMSYYEYTSLNFDRLTDERWKSFWLGQSSENFSVLRPPFVDLYLANTDGKSRNATPVSLPIIPDTTPDSPGDTILTSIYGLYSETQSNISAFPNPFEEDLFISFSLSSPSMESKVDIVIYDVLGNLISKQFSGKLQNGNYALNWAGTDSRGNCVPAGSYICKFTINGLTRTVNLIKN